MISYRRPDGDTWNLYPDADNQVHLDARVIGLMLIAAGYQLVDNNGQDGHGLDMA